MAKLRTAGLDLRVIVDRQVLVFFGDNPIIDKATGAFVGGWESLGLEPEGSSHSHSREVTSTKTNLTGGQIATSYAAGGISGTVDGIDGSPVMRHIENPGAAVEGGVVYGAHSSDVASAYVAFVRKYDSGLVQIWVSREKANLTIASNTKSKDPAAVPVSIDYKNGDDGFYYEERFYMLGEGGAVVAVAPKVFQDVADLAAQITAGTAFHPEASEAGMTAMVITTEDSNGTDLEVVPEEEPEEGTGG